MSKVKKFIFILLWLLYIECVKHSPLVISNIQVNIYREGTGIYELKTDILNFPIDLTTIIFCFKEIKVISNINSQCKLAQKSGSEYSCIRAYYQITNETLIVRKDWDSFMFTNQKGIKQLSNNSTQIQIDTVTRRIRFKNNFFQDFSIYQMITAIKISDLMSFDINNRQYTTGLKFNYLHTYAHDSFVDTLIVQRYDYCHMVLDFIYLIFEGAVNRNQIEHLFTAILTISSDKEKFHMWGGYSFSPSHAGRDMVGYESYNSKFYDLFSLIAGAPYEDIAGNIKGTKNIVRVGNSGLSSILDSPQSPYHFIQFYRQFDTNDTKGDEIIRQKIYNRFCFVSYTQLYDASKVYLFSVLNKSFIHDVIFCHQPTLTVCEKILIIKFLFLFIFFILY